ncbi:DH domain-containing protein [Entamoeba marina]
MIVTPHNLQTYQMSPFSETEIALFNNLYTQFNSTTTGAENGLEVMTDSLSSNAFQSFLTKVNPKLYTNLLNSEDSDVVVSCLNFILMASDIDQFPLVVVKNDNQFIKVISSIIESRDDSQIVITLNILEKFINKLNQSYFISIIPTLINHLQSYDEYHQTSFNCIQHLLTDDSCQTNFIENDGITVIHEMLSENIRKVANACNLLSTITQTINSNKVELFISKVIHFDIQSLLLQQCIGDAAPECLKTLVGLSQFDIFTQELINSESFFILMNCLEFKPTSPYSLQCIKDAILIIEKLVQKNDVLEKLEDIGFSSSLISLLKNNKVIGIDTCSIIFTILDKIIVNVVLLKELCVHHILDVMDSISINVNDTTKTNLYLKIVELCNKNNVEIHQIPIKQKDTNIQKQIESVHVSSLSNDNVYQLNSGKLSPSLSRDKQTEYLSPRSREQKSFSRMKRKAMLMKGFNINDLSEQFKDNDSTTPSSLSINRPLILQSPPKDSTKDKNELICQSTNESTNDVLIEQPKFDSKRYVEEKVNPKPTLQQLKLSLRKSEQHNQAQKEDSFTSFIVSQQKNRKRYLEELLKRQKSFNEDLNKTANVVVPELEKITPKATATFVGFDIITELHLWIELELENVINNDERDVSDVFEELLDNKKYMKAYEQYWLYADVDNVKYMREIPEVTKRLKEFGKQSFLLEKMLLQPMDRLRQFVSILDNFVKYTPECCIEHDKLQAVHMDLVYLIAYFDDQRQSNIGVLKLHKYKQNFSEFVSSGKVLLDNELYVKIGKKTDIVTVVLVKQEHLLLILGVGRKKKVNSVKWSYVICEEMTVSIKDMMVIINVSGKEKPKSKVLKLVFKNEKERDVWYSIIAKER